MDIPEVFIKNCVREFPNNQEDILIEECSELIKALCKAKRNTDTTENIINQVIEEMTHVLISINVVAHQWGIKQSDINLELRKKIQKYPNLGMDREE